MSVIFYCVGDYGITMIGYGVSGHWNSELNHLNLLHNFHNGLSVAFLMSLGTIFLILFGIISFFY